LAAGSGLECGRDFFLGYSPERINPGDREHTVDRITKVVAGQTPEVAERLGRVYGAINGGLVFLARDIKTAEAAKVIENAQRDINIAFINEVTMIFHRLDVSVYDVLEAAGTKWNFLPFKPGLVGGHCIGVDPFYLAHRAAELGHDPEVILAGRRINDAMGDFIVAELDRRIDAAARVLVLGLTFKENVPDLRNAKVIDLIDGLKTRGHRVDVHDPIADPADAAAQYGIELLPTLDGLTGYDCLIGAVSHNAFRALDVDAFAALLTSRGLLADVQGMWRNIELPNPMRRWQL
jgi:UDP-N-acetyl-D-galactosamine dehydrogenase